MNRELKGFLKKCDLAGTRTNATFGRIIGKIIQV